MTDTQWPRYIVFQQEQAGKPHEYAGSVHAPDPEMALLNSRDVFVRRPNCVSLWVVPADCVFARTAEQLRGVQPEVASISHSDEAYLVFQKLTQKGTYVYSGEVTAATPESALRRAIGTLANPAALAWWVFPAQRVTRSTQDDIDALFAPAHNKDFRDQSFYHTVAAMQQLKSGIGDTDES
jgi:phenylacetate-CoA oxygenase PaaH subunit